MGIDGDHSYRTVEQDARLDIQAPRAGAHELSVQARAVFKPRTMVVSLNGVALATAHLSQAGVFQTFDLGTIQLNQGSNLLQIHSVDGCTAASDLDPSNPDSRCRSFDVAQIHLAGL